MATENLQIRITAELTQIRAALQSLQGQLDSARQSGARIGGATAQGIGQLNQRLASTGRLVAGIAASLGASMSIAGLVRASDEAANISARLKLATKDAQQFAIAQRSIFEIAQRSRTSLQASVDLYARIERSTRDIGVNQATILQLTETINQAAQISGGGPGAEAALFQLSQGLASGTLRGEELNSVLEQTPRLAQAIADGMNVPIGKLRQIAKDGQLTSETVLRALLSQSETIQKEFAEFPPTIASGFTAIRNAFIQYLSTSAEAQGAARDLAEALQAIARNLPAIINGFIRLAPVAAAAWLAMKGAAAAPAIIAFFRGLPALLTATSTSFTLVGATASGALLAINIALGVLIAAFAGWQIGTYLSEEFLEVRLFGIAMVNSLMKAWETLKGGVRQIGITLREVFVTAFNFVLDKAASFYKAMGNAVRNIPGIGGKASEYFNGLATSLADSKIEAEGIANAFNRVYRETEAAKDNVDKITDSMVDDEIAAEFAKRAAAGGAAGAVGIPGGGGGGDGGKAAKEAAKLAQINADLIVDAVSRAIEQLDRLYEDGKVSIRDYFAEKQRLELEGIDASILAAQVELRAASNAGEVAQAQANIVKLMRDRKQVAVDAIRAQQEAEEELTRQLGAVQIRLLQATGETGRATRAQLEEEFRELIVRLQAEGDTAGVALAQKLINLETFQAQLDEAGRRVDEAMRKFQAVETSVGAQVQAGMLGQSDGEDRVRAQREASLEALISMRDRYIEIQAAARAANDTMSETKATEAIAELDGQIATLSINVESLGYKAAQVLKGALTQLFTDLASGSKSAGDALKDFVLNFIQGMAQIAANALATYLVLQMLDAIYPGLGKATAALTAASNHSGGMAGEGGNRRTLPALMFAGAPRMHTGGIAGLSADEVPIVAKKGEEVLTRGDPRHRYNGGLGGQEADPGTRFVFVDDQRDVGNYLESARGERTIVKIMERNQLR